MCIRDRHGKPNRGQSLHTEVKLRGSDHRFCLYILTKLYCTERNVIVNSLEILTPTAILKAVRSINGGRPTAANRIPLERVT